MDINVRISVTNEGPGTQAKIKAIAGLGNLKLEMGYVFTATVSGKDWSEIDQAIATIKKTPDVGSCRFDPFTFEIAQHVVENELKKLSLTAIEFTDEMKDQARLAYWIVGAKMDPNTVKRFKVYPSGVVDFVL